MNAGKYGKVEKSFNGIYQIWEPIAKNREDFAIQQMQENLVKVKRASMEWPYEKSRGS